MIQVGPGIADAERDGGLAQDRIQAFLDDLKADAGVTGFYSGADEGGPITAIKRNASILMLHLCIVGS
jgi:hypothetical protein